MAAPERLESSPVPPGQARPAVEGEPTVIAENVHITYTVYEDRRPSLRQLFSQRFKGRASRSIHAVRGVDLTAYAGESIGLIGSNGSGKSTLLRALAGLMPVTEGRVWARAEPALLGVGAALQPALSGRRNIILGGLALGLPRDEVEARYGEIVEFSGLQDAIDLPLQTYSSGMRARLHFALATAVAPDVLLIDEALSVGDKEFQKRSRERIRELQATAGTIFLVSHSMKAILKNCQRAIWLEHGEIQADGRAKDVVAQYEESG